MATIFCVGRNYAAHAAELGNAVEEEPVIFLKPEAALLEPGGSFQALASQQEVHYEAELVLQLSSGGVDLSEAEADGCWGKATVGIDFTDRRLQSKLKARGLPWELSKSFRGSAAVGRWLDRNDLPAIGELEFSLSDEKGILQQAQTSKMVFSPSRVISFLSSYFELRPGDLVFTGTPEGVGPVRPGQTLVGELAGHEVLRLGVD